MSETAAYNAAPGAALEGAADWRDFLALLKPRVMSLVVFTGLVGMLIAPVSLDWAIGLAAIVALAVGAGAAGALNMWYEADIDAEMVRTAKRPIPLGRVDKGTALGFGLSLAVATVAFMALNVNPVAAGVLAFAIFFYVVIYTMGLKRRTPQNIVIGGAAGAFPPVVGWAAATGDISLMPLILFAIVFLWTPPHFWALALVTRTDYARVGVPMMPVVAGEDRTRREILVYSVLLLGASLLPSLFGLAGWLYGGVAALLSALMVVAAYKLWREKSDRFAWRLFGLSIFYLFGLFGALLADYYAGAPW